MFKEKKSVVSYVDLVKMPDFVSREAENMCESSRVYCFLKMWELMIRLLLEFPLRAGTLTRLKIGRNIIKGNNKWKINIFPNDIKTKNEWHFEFPESCVPYLENYLSKIRPILLGTKNNKYLFLKGNGEGISHISICGNIRRLTEKYLGVSIGPHMFRHILANDVLKKDPNMIPAVSRLLMHTKTETVGK